MHARHHTSWLLIAALACAGCSPQGTPTPASRLTVLPRTTSVSTITTAAPATATSLAEAPTATPRVVNTPLPEPTARPPLLNIPEITLEAAIVAVPIVDNAWDVDDLGDKVGWLDGTGNAPGDAYAPVLAAHVSTNTGIAGPFGYLWSLSLGGAVHLDLGDQRYTYEVIDRRKARPEDVAKVLIPDGNRLVLLTCDGWDLTRLTYDERLLVIAELRETAPRP